MDLSKFSFEPIELDDVSTGPIGPGRPTDPAVKELGDATLEIYQNLNPNSRWQNPQTGKAWGIPIPDSVLSEPISHRDGTQTIDKLSKARNFATKIKQYCQRAMPESERENIQVGVIPHTTNSGLVYTLGIRRFANIKKPWDTPAVSMFPAANR